MTHTPTLKEWPEPGVTIKSGVIVDADTGDQVLSLMPKYKVMSKNIIEACNNYAALKKSHAELLETLKTVVLWLDSENMDDCIDVSKLRQAIAKADGRS